MKPISFLRFTTLSGRLSAGQQVWAKVAFDGLNPSELEGDERERARSIFGDIESVPNATRRVLVQVKGRDVGGSRLGAERGVQLALTATLKTGQHELVYVLFCGPKLRLARPALGFALACAKSHGLIVEDDAGDGFTILRPHDGRRVRFEIFAAAKGGENMRGIPILFVMLDEAGFFYDENTGVATGESIFGAIMPRLLPAGQILIVSSPWVESGLLFKEFSRNFGHPETALAGLCPTILMRDDPETLAMIELEYLRDADNARRELGAEFLPIGSGFYFDSWAVKQCAQAGMGLILPPEDGWFVTAGYDPAYVRDAAEGVVLRWRYLNGAPVFQVAEVFTRVPSKGCPLVPSVVDGEFAQLVRRHGGRLISSDAHYQESVAENVGRHGLTLLHAPGGNSGKCDVFAVARELIHAGQVSWSAGHTRLSRQMAAIVAKPLAGGLVQISSPRTRGDHGDAAHALALALYAAANDAWRRQYNRETAHILAQLPPR